MYNVGIWIKQQQRNRIMEISNISTKELSAQLEDSGFTLLDIRPAAAFNGWKLKKEARGGHIHGAVSFPSSWIKDLSRPQLKSLLPYKGITPEKTIVIYGYQGDDCSATAKLLWDNGIRNVTIYEAGLEAWASDPNLTMEHLANYEKLVYPEWVENLISGKMPDHSTNRDHKLFEVNLQDFAEYQAGHIPGAIYFDLGSIESAPSWNIHSDDEILKFLLAQGITHDSLIVLYGRNPMAVARAASALMYAGVEDLRVLDGGFDAWRNSGHEIETEAQEPIPVKDFGRSIPAHPEYIIDIDATKELLADDQGVLVCARSWDEHIGKTSGYDYIQAKGRIAGSVWGRSGSGPHNMENYRNLDNTMRSYHEIESIWQEAGINPDKKVAFYCGSGWRASEAFFYAYLMGWQNIAVYDGGWLEWSQDGTNPIATGLP
jgi:thiosulfate/3-mercaptopyruvate sulfurtransferase